MIPLDLLRTKDRKFEKFTSAEILKAWMQISGLTG
jgi:hypothetical protein